MQASRFFARSTKDLLPLIALVSTLALASQASASTEPQAPSPDVRVRLQQLKNTASISGINLRITGAPLPTKNQTDFGYKAIRVTWAKVPNGFREWLVTDRDKGTVLAKVRARTFEVAGTSLRLNLQSVPDRLTIYPTQKNAADLIASMNIEDYVRGVLPAEMPANWPLEALKAQAVAARTFALFRKASRERVKAAYDLEADVMDQVFLMPLKSGPMADKNDQKRLNVERAVNETRGLLLQDRKAHLFATYFHADCGGQTEDARTVWGDAPNTGTAIDGACPISPHAKWNFALSSREITKKLISLIYGKSSLMLVSLDPMNRSASGRVQNLKFTWSDGTNSVLSAHQFRMALGHEQLKSTNFEVSQLENGLFQFSGKGFGHGVGLCQWGSRHLAQNGMGFKDILHHYYPKAQLRSRVLL
jgi:stage II sporulation protein D